MIPESYRHWQDAARRLLEPLAALMQPGQADLAIKGPASDHDAQADRLESFARPLLLAAHGLQTVPLLTMRRFAMEMHPGSTHAAGSARNLAQRQATTSSA